MVALFAESRVAVPDIVMLLGYFTLMLGIGAYFYRFMRGLKAYFTGGNKIPWWLSGVSFYMSSFSAYAFVVFSGLCFDFGWVGMTLFSVSAPAALFSALLFSKLWRRSRTVSPVEFLETRYNGAVRQIFAWGGVPIGLIDDSLKLIATATILHTGLQMTFISLPWMLFICGVIIIGYTFMGGLWAVTVTDFVQFAILVVGVLIVFTMTMLKAGGFAGFSAYAPTSAGDFWSEKYNWFYLAMLLVLYCISWSSTNWHLIQKYFCVATERDAKKVGLLVVLLYIGGVPLILTPAIAARQFLPSTLTSTEVYPMLCRELLPVGMLGLVIAAMFSSTAGNLSSHFNVWASVLTNDVYRRLFRRHAGDRELVAAGRAMTLFVGGLTIGCALLLRNADAKSLFNYMVTIFGAIVAPLGIPMMAGLLSRRVNTLSVLASMIANAIVLVVLFRCLPDEFQFGGMLLARASVIIAITTVLTITLLFGISAIFPMGTEERRRVDAFRNRLETPIGELPEDQAAAAHEPQPLSPFFIAGICLACMGVLMLVITIWVDDSTAKMLNAILGGALALAGGVMSWASNKARLAAQQRAALAPEAE